MKRTTTLVIGAALLVAAACADNPSAPSTDRVPAGSAQTLQALVTGLTAQLRVATGPTSAGSASPYFAYGDIMARDAIRPDPNETRWVSEFYESPPDPSDFIGGTLWSDYYSAIRAAHSILRDQALLGQPAPQQAAARGYVRVIEAIAYLQLIEYHDVEGAPIQGDDPTTVNPMRTKQAVLAYTSALLDTAITDLTSAGSIGVPFTVPPGYRMHGDYGTTDALRRLAHGLKGKAETLRATDQQSPNAASAAVAVSELNAALAGGTATADYLAQGPYFEYNPGAPESFGNPLVDLKLLLTDNFVSSIAAGDARAQTIIPAARQNAGSYGASYRERYTDPTNSANTTLPLPIIRNAELYLLRAQARLVGGDLAGAMADVNVVHMVEGGLPALAPVATVAAVQDAILYEYRYSFILQGPQHLVALRSYKRLDGAYVSQPGMPTPGASLDAFVQTLPIPKSEVDARNGDLTPKP